MSSLVILAAAMFEISCGKTDRQAGEQTPLKTRPPYKQTNELTDKQIQQTNSPKT